MSTTNAANVSRVKAIVSFVTWVPSDAGRINMTDKTGMTIAVWVNHPLDGRWKLEDRGGEQAIRIARAKMEAHGVEWLGLLAVQVNTDDREDAIVNQPKRAKNDLGIEEGELGDRPKLVVQ